MPAILVEEWGEERGGSIRSLTLITGDKNVET